MGFIDALAGNAPQIQVGNQVPTYQVQGLNFANPYSTGLTNDAALRQRQMSFLDALNASAQGQGAGAALAQAQLQQNLGRAEAGVANQIASNRGLSPATKAFLMAQSQGQAGAQAAAGAAATRAQQQLGAQGQLGSALGAFRGQDQAATGMAQQGQLAQEGLRAGAAQSANALNAQIGINQAQMQQRANEGSLQALGGGINGMGGAAEKILGLASGGNIDTSSADTVPAMLSPGERVLPRSISHDPQASAEFISALNAMDGGGAQSGGGDGFIRALAAKNAELERRTAMLEAALGGRR